MTRRNILVAVAGVLFLIVVVGAMVATQWPAGSLTSTDTKDLGTVLFNQYGLAILLVGITLFVSMLGGIYIAQEEKE